MQPQPIHLPSGNLIADRRFEWARDLADKGDLAGAADLLTQVLELEPRYASAWFTLGELREKLGDPDAAIAAYQQARAADPRDAHGAAVRLARLGAIAPDAMPAGYVRTLFDGYAPAFDSALTEGLNYRGPELLLHALQATQPGRHLKFGSVLDLGCGTGLAGQAMRPYCDWLVGVDLSPGMLAQARAKGIYDRLVEADVMTFLAQEAALGARYHLIVAADVFVYFHALTQMPPAVRHVLEPGGLVAFSLETHAGEGVILRETLRYAHGAAHVREALSAGDLTLISLDSASTRTEKGVPVPGLIVVARN